MKKQRLGRSLAIGGCALVMLAFVLVVLVTVDKRHFGWLVGTAFLVAITSAVILGGLLVGIGTFFMPIRNTWRGWVLFAWALIAVTSPLFGIFLILLPWSLLMLTVPVVLVILFNARFSSPRPA